jgi:hypothetical protein
VSFILLQSSLDPWDFVRDLFTLSRIAGLIEIRQL